MVAPLVVSLMVTVWVVVYVPATGLKVGVAAACVIVYAALPTALCEKPLAITLAQADEMLRTAKEKNLLLIANLMQRYNGLFEIIRRLVELKILAGP